MHNIALELLGMIIGLSVLVIILIIMVKIMTVLFRVFFVKSTPTPKTDSAEDTRMIQEIHQSLIKMEGRIDTLETILLSKEEHHAEAQKLHDFERKIERGL